MAEAWYSEGLKFTCTRCGNCCTGAPGYVWVDQEEIARLARRKAVTAQQFVAMYTRKDGGRLTLRDDADGNCVFYNRQSGCTVYDDRPTQCRTWPFWQSAAGTPEAWQRTQMNCPGAGQGDLHSAEDISRRMALVLI